MPRRGTPVIAHSDVQAAADRVAGRIRRTPLIEVGPAPLAPAGRTWLKLELTQHTGSFKARGAFNHILAARDEGRLPGVGVVAASGGNAGLAFGYAAAEVGVPAEVFVPETAPAVKVARLRALGATVVQVGTRYAEAQDAATKRSPTPAPCSATPTTCPPCAPGRAPSAPRSWSRPAARPTPCCWRSAAEG